MCLKHSTPRVSRMADNDNQEVTVADQFSFDVVSEVNMQEMKNVVGYILTLNPPTDNDEANLGIFRPDGTMKPVGQVIKELKGLFEVRNVPTTATERFFLTMRAYFPRQEMLDGRYVFPKVTEI